MARAPVKLTCLGCDGDAEVYVRVAPDLGVTSGYICDDCYAVFLGFLEPPGPCTRCGGQNLEPVDQEVPMCPTCAKRLLEGQKAVDAGGVWWMCQACRCSGYAPRTSRLVQALTEKSKIRPGSKTRLLLERCSYCDSDRAQTPSSG
jgi:hypothetical protein